MAKKIDLKDIPLPILIIVGILASAISFVYYFALKNPFEIIFWMICIIDFLLFALSAYRLVVDRFDLTKAKTVIFTIVTMVGFLVFAQIVVLAFTQGTRFEYTLELFLDVLRFSLFLSPSLILLLPIIWFICEILS